MGIKKTRNYDNLTVLYVHPKIMTRDELIQSNTLIEEVYGGEVQSTSAEIETKKSLQEYFDERTLNIAKDYETKELLGFLCANTDQLLCGNSQFLDYLLIKKCPERSLQLRIYRRLLLLIGRDFNIAMGETGRTFDIQTNGFINTHTDEYGNIVYPDKEHVKQFFKRVS